MLFVVYLLMCFAYRVLCFALTTKGYSARIGIVIEQRTDYLFIVRGPNTWMTKDIYVEIVRFVIRLESGHDLKKILIDDICSAYSSGHQSELVKGYLYNDGYLYTSVPGGGTGNFFFYVSNNSDGC